MTQGQHLSATDDLTDEARWQAVLARDAGFDSRFVYGVHSTGIYCRPSCPARRPTKSPITFFAGPAAAEQAGFRPCRRCQPRATESEDTGLALVQRACRRIEAGLAHDELLPLDSLGHQLGVEPHQLRRVFRRVLGVTPRQYADACRLDRLKARLKEGETVTTALYAAGYGSSSRLYERAPTRLGMTPATYGRGGQGAQISYTTIASPLGRLLVAGTARGLCFVCLGGDDAPLVAALTREYPAAAINRDDARLAGWASALLDHLTGQQPSLDLPLDVWATAFQARVWEALRAIPYGETRSYRAIARDLGQPAAVRAVARACATNPVAVAVPCHRVVREDGGLGGYRWGIERKQALLAQERAASQGTAAHEPAQRA